MKNVKGKQTYNEILGQFDSWRKNLNILRERSEEIQNFGINNRFDNIVLIGCGTSYYLALSAAFLLTNFTKTKTVAIPASEVFFFPRCYLNKTNLIIAISRSGSTTEVLKAVEESRRINQSKVLGIVCREGSPLCRMADFCLAAVDAEDESVVQTRSFTTMYIMLLAYAAMVGGHQEYFTELEKLPDIAESVTIGTKKLVQDLGQSKELRTFVFLGSGHNYGLACAAMLNLKETSLSHTEAYHFMEFRHGPFSILDRSTLVIGFISDSVKEYEIPVLKEAASVGAKVLALAKSPINEAHYNIAVPHLSEYVRSIAFFPALHLLSFYRAIAKGLDPDAPPNLRRVITF